MLTESSEWIWISTDVLVAMGLSPREINLLLQNVSSVLMYV